VHFPTLADGTTPQERVGFERHAARARYFGGSPRVGGTQTAAMKPPEMPKIEAPVSRTMTESFLSGTAAGRSSRLNRLNRPNQGAACAPS